MKNFMSSGYFMNAYVKKILSSFCLFAVVLFALSCAESKKKTISVKEFVLVDRKDLAYHNDPQRLTKSLDGNSIYLTVNGDNTLIYGDASDADKGIAWKEISLKTGLSGAAGLAELADAESVTHISAGKKGAMISVTGGEGSKGAFYVEGATHKAAWASRPEDLNTLAAPVGGIAPPPAQGRFAYDAAITGILVQDKDGKDVPYFWGMDSNNAVNRNIGLTKSDLSPAAAAKDAVVLNTGPRARGYFIEIPKLMASGSDRVFLLISRGITAISREQAGTVVDFPNVERNTAPQASGAVGSDAFKMKATQDNNIVQNIAIFGNKLYIGFGHRSLFQGGVVIYHIPASAGAVPEISAPDKKWSAISVKDFFEKGGAVWAVSDRAVYKIVEDAASKTVKRGPSFADELPEADLTFDNASDGYLKETIPREINLGTINVNGNLFIATQKGLFMEREREEIIYKDKEQI